MRLIEWRGVDEPELGSRRWGFEPRVSPSLPPGSTMPSRLGVETMISGLARRNDDAEDGHPARPSEAHLH